MQIRLGYSTGVFWNYDLPLKEILKILLKVSDSAVEIMFKRPINLDEKIDKETINLIKKFKYRSIHAPCSDVKYPSKNGNIVVEKILKLVGRVKSHTILFHPDEVYDFQLLNKKFGNKLAFENMDNRNKKGKTIPQLNEVFKKSPQAKFVFDLNHLYTHNPSMCLAKKYHNAFGNRLCHYHFSGYGGFHNCISQTKENIIFSGLMDLSKPIINEGASKNMKDIIHQENKYILDFLTG